MAENESKLGRIAVDGDTLTASYDNCGMVYLIPKGTNPTGTIWVDFGTGCLGADGRTRKGIIRWTYTDRLRKPGAIITTQFLNYAVKPAGESDFIAVDNSSTKVTTNESTSEISSTNSLMSLKRVINMKLNFADNTNFTWMGTKNLTWDLGQLGNKWDNVYTLKSGSGLSGTGRQGQPYTLTVNNDVIRKTSCQLIGVFKPVSGKITIQHNSKTKVIDYGNGTCDNSVSVTVNGVLRTFRW
jgi:hypothetical protein